MMTVNALPKYSTPTSLDNAAEIYNSFKVYGNDLLDLLMVLPVNSAAYNDVARRMTAAMSFRLKIMQWVSGLSSRMAANEAAAKADRQYTALHSRRLPGYGIYNS